MQEEREKFKIKKRENIDKIIETAEEREKLLKKYIFISTTWFLSEGAIDFIKANGQPESIPLILFELLLCVSIMFVRGYDFLLFAKGMLVNDDLYKLLELCFTDLKDVIESSNSIETNNDTDKNELNRIK